MDGNLLTSNISRYLCDGVNEVKIKHLLTSPSLLHHEEGPKLNFTAES